MMNTDTIQRPKYPHSIFGESNKCFILKNPVGGNTEFWKGRPEGPLQYFLHDKPIRHTAGSVFWFTWGDEQIFDGRDFREKAGIEYDDGNYFNERVSNYKALFELMVHIDKVAMDNDMNKFMEDLLCPIHIGF